MCATQRLFLPICFMLQDAGLPRDTRDMVVEERQRIRTCQPRRQTLEAPRNMSCPNRGPSAGQTRPRSCSCSGIQYC
jgi:hypothetical protein